MAKSPRQAGPPAGGDANPEPAPEAGPEPAADAAASDPAAAAAETPDGAAAEPDGAAAAEPDGAATEPDGDELRRKFREALEHKRSDSGVGSGGPGGGGKSAIRSSNARTQRLFRRKSG